MSLLSRRRRLNQGKGVPKKGVPAVAVIDQQLSNCDSLFATFEENLCETSSVTQVIPPEFDPSRFVVPSGHCEVP